MHLRRSLALLSGALIVAAPLSSCGFDLATDRVNQVAAGTNNRDASVDVLGAVLVSAEEGSGTFIASFVNNSLDETATVEALEPQDAESAQVEFEPIEIDPNSIVNLAQDDQGVPVEGDFGPGGSVPMSVTLSDGNTLEIDVPVVPNCREWEGLDGPVSGDCEVAEPVGEH